MNTEINALKLGKALKDILKPVITAYAVIADHGAKYPFAVFRRTSLQPQLSKTLYNFCEIVGLQITIAAADYDNSIELAQKIKDILEHRHQICPGVVIDGVDLMDANEDWNNDAYIQNLHFRVKLTKL